MYETVVIATDGSDSGGRAVEEAVDLADRFGAAVHALYVVDEGRLRELPTEVRESARSAYEAQGREAVAVVAAAAEGVTTEVRAGRPASEIVDYAEEVGADLVATGTRGRGGDHGFHLGSVAEEVVRRCPVPVLTVRQREP